MDCKWKKFSLEKVLKLPIESDGTRVLTTVCLETDFPTRGRRIVSLKIESNIRAIQCNLVVEVDYPFITVVSEDKLEESISKNMDPDTGFFLNPEDNLYYLVPIDVLQDFYDIREVCRPRAIEDGYDEETEQYYYNGVAFEEGDVVFVGIEEVDKEVPPEKQKPWIANSDVQKNEVYEFFDVRSIKDIDYLKDVETTDYMPCDTAWLTIREKVASQKKVGIAIVFLEKKMMIPVQSFYNNVTKENEQLLVVFNACECYSYHHNCKWFFSGDIGNLTVDVYARYLPGAVLDWEKIIGRRVEEEKKSNPQYSEYADPDGDGPKIVLL